MGCIFASIACASRLHDAQSAPTDDRRGDRFGDRPSQIRDFATNAEELCCGMSAHGPALQTSDGAPAAFEELNSWPLHIPHGSDSLKNPDEACRRIELIAVDAVTGKGGARVMEIVPVLPHRQDRQWGEIRRFVINPGDERPASPEMADRN